MPADRRTSSHAPRGDTMDDGDTRGTIERWADEDIEEIEREHAARFDKQDEEAA